MTVMYPQTKGKDVRWSLQTGGTAGYGFIAEDGKIALIKCPECGRENYAMNVLSGKCTWCPFDANVTSLIKEI